MPGLIHEINSPEEAIQYALDNPDRVTGDILWALMRLQSECACRRQTCLADMKKGRLKNIAFQVGGGVAGGAVAMYSLWVIHQENILAAIAEYVKRKMGS